MKSAWARENYGTVALDVYGSVALFVVVTECTPQARQNICHALFMMRPFVDAGILQVEHHTRCARVQHLDAQFRIVSGTGHLVALVLAPLRQHDSPAVSDRIGR